MEKQFLTFSQFWVTKTIFDLASINNDENIDNKIVFEVEQQNQPHSRANLGEYLESRPLITSQ